MQETCGRQDPLYGIAIGNIGSCYEAQGELDQALANYAQALEVYQVAFGEGSMQCARETLSQPEFTSRRANWTMRCSCCRARSRC